MSEMLAKTLLLPGQPLPAPSSSSAMLLEPRAGAYRRSEYVISSAIGVPSFLLRQKAAKRSASSPQIVSASVVSPVAPLSRLPEPESYVLARVTRITSRQAVCSILLVLPDRDTLTVAGQEIIDQPLNTLPLSQALASGVANHAAGEDSSGLDFSGVIRQQDVRLTETDKVKIAECFRVGDLVKAKVVSLGDSRSYFLSTASNELGVIFATASPSSDVLYGLGDFLPRALITQSPARTRTSKDTKTSSQTSSSIPGALTPLDWQTMIDKVTGRIEKRKVAKPDGL